MSPDSSSFGPFGPTPYGSFQQQVAHTVKDETRRDFTYVSRVLGYGPCKTPDDVAELVAYYIHYVPEPLYFKDGKGNEIEIRGIETLLTNKDLIIKYFTDTLVFEFCRSKIKKAIQDRWYEETRPRNLDMEKFGNYLQILMGEVTDQWDRDHPEEVPKGSPKFEALQAKVDAIWNSINEAKRKEDSVPEGPSPETEDNDKASESPMHAPDAQSGPVGTVQRSYISYRTERLWMVAPRDDGRPEAYEDARDPDDLKAFVNMRVEFGSGSTVFYEIFYNVRFMSLDGFHIFVSRVKDLLTQFLYPSPEEGMSMVDTLIPFYPDLNVPNPIFLPRMHNGQIEKKVSSYRIRREKEYDLTVVIGKHVLKWTVKLDRGNVGTMMSNIAELLEMVLLSGEGEKEPSGVMMK
ncbi:MAG: hypothetical protein M0Z77_01570 [Thermoplasmatales archaeon]|nr:hypothetical protein [Thermoplasmatales archaeon]